MLQFFQKRKKFYGLIILVIIIIFLTITVFKQNPLSESTPLHELNPLLELNCYGSKEEIEYISKNKYPAKLLIFVITTESNLKSRGIEVICTWMKHANIINPNLGISVVLASDALVPEEYNIPTLDYKQIPSENYQNLSLKVFEIFKIVWKNYGSRYDYFMKADDDVFIKIEKLSKTFFNTNSDLYDSESIEYFGYPDPYQKLMCWGGPGYIISRGTLRLIYPYLEFCENEFHYGEDISLYQCIEYVTKLLNKTSEFKGCQHLHNQSGKEFLHLDIFDENWKFWDKPNYIFNTPLDKGWNFGNAITVHSLKPGNNITMRDLEERYGREN